MDCRPCAWKRKSSNNNCGIRAASSGDTIYVHSGTYTEDITLPAGINITGIPGQSRQGNAILVGKITQTATGTSTIANMRLQTNGDVIFDVGGSGVIQTSFMDCNLFLTDGDCLTVNNANASPNFYDCNFHQTANSLDLFNITSCMTAKFFNCRVFNSGVTPGVSDIASGTVEFTRLSVIVTGKQI